MSRAYLTRILSYESFRAALPLPRDPHLQARCPASVETAAWLQAQAGEQHSGAKTI